jgi:putative lipoic acid-binding regulatory protein
MIKHNQEFHPENLKKNSSKKGNYIALTLNLKVDSQKELDAIYNDFSRNNHFKFVL